MKFEKALEYLKNKHLRRELIAKLRNAGEKSEGAKALERIIIQLRLREMADGAEGKTEVQEISKFFTPEEGFVIFRLVSKKWKKAIENIRVNAFPREDLLLFDAHNVNVGTDGYLNFLRKYLRIFSNVKFKLSSNFVSNWNILTPIIFENMHNLQCISITYPDNFFTPDGNTKFEINVPYNEFITEFIHNNRKTLTHVEIPTFCTFNIVLNDVHFMAFTLKRPNIGTFINNFPVALSNMKNLKIVEINLRNHTRIFSNQILQSDISQYFITGDVGFLGLLPLKIVTGVDVLTRAENFSEHVQYLDIVGIPYEEPDEEGWAEYVKIFRSFPNLKGIVLNTHTPQDFLNCNLGAHIDEEFQIIWRDRVLNILEVLELEILNREEVYKNVQLELKLARENGVRVAIRLV